MKTKSGSLSAEEIKTLDSNTFKQKLAALDEEFSKTFAMCTTLAKEIKKMKENCPHRNAEPRFRAQWCPDCGEYFKVDVSFSPETEAWFTHQNRLAEVQRSEELIDIRFEKTVDTEDSQYYQYLRTDLSRREWKQLTQAKLPPRPKRVIQVLHACKNTPTPGAHFTKNRRFDEKLFNQVLRKHGLLFQLRKVGWGHISGQYMRWYQLFKVKPTALARKYWRR